jgi:hypothetical protein
MRRRRGHVRDDVRGEPSAPRDAVEDIDRVLPDVERLSTWVPEPPTPVQREPQTPADRAAARRRLDHLADEW